MSQTTVKARFGAGQRILATRSGHCSHEELAEVLHVRATETAEVYHVRWQDGLETWFVPGSDAHDRRVRDVGPPAGVRERRGR